MYECIYDAEVLENSWVVWCQLAVNVVQVETSFKFLSHPGWNRNFFAKIYFPESCVFSRLPHIHSFIHCLYVCVCEYIYTRMFICVCV